MKIIEHKCSGQLSWLDVTADVDSSGRGLHETTVSTLTGMGYSSKLSWQTRYLLFHS